MSQQSCETGKTSKEAVNWFHDPLGPCRFGANCVCTYYQCRQGNCNAKKKSGRSKSGGSKAAAKNSEKCSVIKRKNALECSKMQQKASFPTFQEYQKSSCCHPNMTLDDFIRKTKSRCSRENSTAR